MGGGERKGRGSHVTDGIKNDIKPNKKITDYNNSEKPRVFISFHHEDEAQVDLLRSQAKDPRFPVEFIDYSVKEPFDEKWKTQCVERIKRSKACIVMIGPETYSREAVLWEIKKAHELGIPVLGVRIYRDKKHKIPTPIIENGDKVINWDTVKIQKWLEKLSS